MIALDKPYEVLPHIMTREVEGETVIMDIERGVYSGLNHVGTRVLDLIKDGHTLSQIITHIDAEYDVSTSIARQDVIELMQSLLAKNLIRERV